MTVYREALMIGFRATTLDSGRMLTLAGPSETVDAEGEGRPAFDVEQGKRPSDPVHFQALGLRGADSDSMLAVAAELKTTVYSVAVEDLDEDGRQWTPCEGWTVEDFGPADEPLSVPERFEVRSVERAMDAMLFRVTCVRMR